MHRPSTTNAPPLGIEAFEQLRQHAEKQLNWQRRYGHVRQIPTLTHKGYRFVAVGPSMMWSDKWLTFTDFLIAYMSHVFRKKWYDDELRKSKDSQHQIVRWYCQVLEFQKTHKIEGKWEGYVNGACLSYLSLAFDLFVLSHHIHLQQRLINRLKNHDQFQGARYEVYVAATCIRAGYEVTCEDERDLSTQHPEFTCKHKSTAFEIAVEAKSRHRPGVLGFPERPLSNSENSLGIEEPLRKALSKKISCPYVVFLDLNLPPTIRISQDKTLRDQAFEAVNSVSAEPGMCPYQMIMLTNFPWHYTETEQVFHHDVVSVFPEPMTPSSRYYAELHELCMAAQKCIPPNSFDEL